MIRLIEQRQWFSLTHNTDYNTDKMGYRLWNIFPRWPLSFSLLHDGSNNPFFQQKQKSEKRMKMHVSLFITCAKLFSAYITNSMNWQIYRIICYISIRKVYLNWLIHIVNQLLVCSAIWLVVYLIDYHSIPTNRIIHIGIVTAFE